MDLGIAGRVALVTAASKGLGRATAVALAQEGAKVVICARGAEALAGAEAELAAHTEVLAIPDDVTEPAAPSRLVDAAVARFGRLDIVVANAGGPPAGRALDVTDAQIEAAVNSNLLTSVRLVREAVPHMRKEGWGRICLITSSSIKQPIATLSLSNAARTGLWAWAKTAATDLFAEGITLNLACPGLHDTERMQAIPTLEGPRGDPADFGRVVAFLCSEPAKFMSGSTVLVDGARAVGLV
ncbi:MAG TPA: SDR family NAD(P)-dependent oxidoreductase [Acidimicrobiales bacterium]|nr:SDR family NAD(P)-dependent oxidoreductase [Acidimicrobiales bacterium]